MGDELNLSDLKNQTKLNRDHRLKLLNLQRKILEARVERLEHLKRHYEEDKLDSELKCFKAKLDTLVNKTEYMVLEAHKKKMTNIEDKLKEQNSALDSKLVEAKSQLNTYQSLDPNTLAEYLRLKDDLECQELLIKLSEDNTMYRSP